MASAPPACALFYGNQPYAVEQAAARLIDRVLGEGPRDFSLQRFDAAELVRAGAGDAAAEAAGALQLACETAPFLCERWVVRVDHVEVARISDRAAANLQRALEALQLQRCRPAVADAGPDPVWALEDDLTPEDTREGGLQPQPFVAEVQSRSDGPPLLHLRPSAAGARCLRAHGASRSVVDVKTFLRGALKPKFAFADEAGEAGPAAGGGPAATRLHQVLERLLANPPAGLCLVLTAQATRDSDLSRPLLAAAKAKGPLEKFVTYDDYNPVDFVLQGARERGLRLGRDQAELVIHLAGNELGRLASELDKLALLFEGGAPPDEAALVRAVSGGQGASLFLITDKLGGKDLSGALAVLEQFLAETPHEHPVLIGILARHTRQLLHVHNLVRLRVPEADWPAQLKLHPFLARKVTAQARRFRQPELEAMQRALAGLDVAAKRYGALTAPLFREYVHAVCSGAFAAPGAPLGSGLAALR